MERREAFTFKTPTSLMIAGPSGCGKTVFTTRLLLDNPDLFRTLTNAIHYCYGSWQHGFELLKQCGIQFHEGVPDRSLLPKWFPEGGILILDDLMNEGGSDKNVLDLFTKDSHHQKITVIYLCQLFQEMSITSSLLKTHVINWGCEIYYNNRSPPSLEKY